MFVILILDPRVNHWMMMSSPLPTMVICLCYAYFSKVLGPRIMENKKPYKLRGILISYNLIQTLFSTWIFYEVRQHFFFFSSYYTLVPSLASTILIESLSRQMHLYEFDLSKREEMIKKKKKMIVLRSAVIVQKFVYTNSIYIIIVQLYRIVRISRKNINNTKEYFR